MSRINSATGKYAILFLGCVLFHVIDTWSLPLIDRDEPRFAEASREMIEGNDYIVPHFNNQLRLDKPPLAYWTQVASYKILGENAFAARFPSSIAAALVAISIFAWGARMGSEGMGLRAAIIFTLCLQTFVHAKAAVADMWLVLFVTTAHWAGYEILQLPMASSHESVSTQGAAASKPPWAIWKSPFLVFYLSLAFGFLAKGPIAWVPLLTVGSIILFTPNLQLGRRFKFVRGTLLMLAIVALWGVPALIRTHGAFLSIGIGRHVVARSFGALEGHGWNSFGGYLLLLPFYFITIFVSFFPWSFRLPPLIKRLWQAHDKIDNYLIAGTAVVFIIFTLVKTKLPHYTLPAFPLLSLLLARYWSPRELLGGTKLDGFKPSSLSALESQAAVGRGRSFFRPMAIVTTCLWVGIALVVPPLVAGSFPAYALSRESRDYLRPEMEFGAVNYQEPSLVWYFRSRIKGWMTPLRPANVSAFMEKPGPRFVVLPRELVATAFPNLPPNWKMLSTRGFNIAKAKRVDLTMILKSD